MGNAQGKSAVRLAVLAIGAACMVGCGDDAPGGSADAAASPEADVGAGDAGARDADGDAMDADAGPDAARCAALQGAADTQFEPLVEQNLACSQDSDCVLTSAQMSNVCLVGCPILTDEAGAAAVMAAATELCKPFVAAGCTVDDFLCPAKRYVCAGGTCSVYSMSVVPDLVNYVTQVGSCFALTLQYSPQRGSPEASRDRTVEASGYNAELFVDAACTVPLTGSGLTVKAGTSRAAFGVKATAAGIGNINVADVTYAFTAR